MKRYGSKCRSCCLKLDAVILPLLENYRTLTKSIGCGKQQQCPLPISVPSCITVYMSACISQQQSRSFHISHVHSEEWERWMTSFKICNQKKKKTDFFKFWFLWFVLFWFEPSWSSGVLSVYPEINQSGWRHRAEWELLSHRATFHKKASSANTVAQNKEKTLLFDAWNSPSFVWRLAKTHTHTNTLVPSLSCS